jgi:hypothetical protein
MAPTAEFLTSAPDNFLKVGVCPHYDVVHVPARTAAVDSVAEGVDENAVQDDGIR